MAWRLGLQTVSTESVDNSVQNFWVKRYSLGLEVD